MESGCAGTNKAPPHHPTQRENGPPKKNTAPGRVSDFTGEKEQWLSGFRQQLLDADDVGTVYTDATNQFLLRYGYDLPFNVNVDGDLEDDPPSTEPMDDTEQDRRDTIQGQLRAVRFNLPILLYAADCERPEIVQLLSQSVQRQETARAVHQQDLGCHAVTVRPG
jgi:hypothetical protein